jgi:hypothetical protein
MKQFLISAIILIVIFILSITFSEQLEEIWVQMRINLYHQIKNAAINGEDTFWMQFRKLVLDKFFGFAFACVFIFLFSLVGVVANIGPMFAAFGLMKATK